MSTRAIKSDRATGVWLSEVEEEEPVEQVEHADYRSYARL